MKFYAAIIAFISTLLTIYATIRSDVFGGAFSKANIYYSDYVPYWNVNSKDTENSDIKYWQSHSAPIPDAFSLRCFIKNPKSNSVRVEDVQTEILDIELSNDDDIHFISIATKHTLKIYAVNNGWGSNMHNVVFGFSPVAVDSFGNYIRTEDNTYPLNNLGDPVFSQDSFVISPGDIVLISEYQLDPAKIQAIKSDSSESSIFCPFALKYRLDDSDYIMRGTFVKYYYDIDAFIIQGIGGWEYIGYTDDYSLSLVASLDVDKAPKILHYSSPQSSPQIAGHETYCLTTVIVPTKSCTIKCKNIMYIDGVRQESGVSEVYVQVPVYYNLSSLVTEIDQSIDTSPSSIHNIKENYKYDFISRNFHT